MIVSITYIELKGPHRFFLLSWMALKIIRQLKPLNCKAFKKKGWWTKHYTMTLWNDESEMINFVASPPHAEAMKMSAKIAREIRTATYQADALPSWEEARVLVNKGKVQLYL